MCKIDGKSPEKWVSDFLSFFRMSDDALRAATDELDRTNLETQDILHRIELYEDKYHETAALGKKLREVRRRRRVAKENIEMLTPVVDFAEENKCFLSGLQRVLGDLRKIERRQENRAYAPRTDILEELRVDQD